ncbi:hypothetical protein ACN6MY_12570 [Peribacillus sp. B-H-3]|uniref:hypothetical protein n=1 Tax=Peribacillus sp. B-H-3 TaxID=3400420 RepID=UPI003B028A0A
MKWKSAWGREGTKKEDLNIGNTSLLKLIDELDQLGFYKYLDYSEDKDKAKQEAIKTGYIYGDIGREFPADEEDLSEGGVGAFFEEITPFLRKQGVQLIINHENFSEEKYEIQVNGENYTLYSQKDLESEEYIEKNTHRAFSIINKILEESGSKERLCALYEWNDQIAIFLTNEMYEKIIELELDKKEIPKRII